MPGTMLKALPFFVPLLLAGALSIAGEPKPIPNYKLVDQNTKPVDLHSFKGKYVVASFVFTRCPMSQMCPLTLSLSRELIEKWKSLPTWRKKGFPIHLLAITLDPSFDSPQVMKAHMESRGIDADHFTFLTGEANTLSALASEFNIIGVPSGGTISHNMKTIVLSPLMVPIKEYSDNSWTPDEILKLIQGSVGWWQWFFLASALLAAPGLYLVIRMRRYATS